MNVSVIKPMEEELITIPLQEIFPTAERYFLKTAGLDINNEKHSRMRTRALAIYEEIREKSAIKTVIRYLTPDEVRGKDLSFRGVKISSNAFERLGQDNINGAYFYLITAGHVQTESGQVIDQLYADIWGTSLIDAARDMIRNYIQSLDSKKGDGRVLSASFGPGYYGMGLTQTADLYHIIDFSTVNVELSPGGMMIPQKSITGLYMSVKDPTLLPPDSCESCIGGASGCAFCNQQYVEKRL